MEHIGNEIPDALKTCLKMQRSKRLTFTQLLTLMAWYDDRVMIIDEVSERLGLENPHTSNRIRPLLLMNFIERKCRGWFELTDKGREELRKLYPDDYVRTDVQDRD